MNSQARIYTGKAHEKAQILARKLLKSFFSCFISRLRPILDKENVAEKVHTLFIIDVMDVHVQVRSVEHRLAKLNSEKRM